MRISAALNDPGYANYRGACRVFLDDVEMADVLAADPDEGYVELAVRLAPNRLFVVGGEIVRETRNGAVRIEMMNAAPAAELSADAARAAAKRELRKFF